MKCRAIFKNKLHPHRAGNMYEIDFEKRTTEVIKENNLGIGPIRHTKDKFSNLCKNLIFGNVELDCDIDILIEAYPEYFL